jgi:hypothetical protein
MSVRRNGTEETKDVPCSHALERGNTGPRRSASQPILEAKQGAYRGKAFKTVFSANWVLNRGNPRPEK